MKGVLHGYLAADHRRLEALLERAEAGAPQVDREAYAAFRAGLLRHISMEEKILLPEAQRRRGGEPLAQAAQLRLEHGAIAALLVPSPSADVIATLRVVLAAHDPIEEDAEGVYALCEELAGDAVEDLLARLRAAPEVRVAAHVDGARVLASARRALERAGFEVAALPLTRQE